MSSVDTYLKQIYKYWNMCDAELPRNIKWTSLASTCNETCSLLSSIPDKIQSYWNKNGHTYKCAHITYQTPKQRVINVYISSKKITHQIQTDNIKFALKSILLLEKLEDGTVPFPIFLSSENQCSKTLNIYILHTPFKKILSSKPRQPLEPWYCNTGFSFSCKKDNEILIFREEEWKKVLIHEMIHAFGGDTAENHKFLGKDCNLLLHSMFRGLHPDMSDLRAYEACTELWANLIYISTCGPKKDAVKEQQVWSVFQAVKLLNHYQLSYQELIDGSSHTFYEKDTTAFSYYILRCILFCHIDAFMELCNKHTTKSLSLPNNLVDFIQEFYQEKEFMKMMDNLYRQFSLETEKSEELLTLKMCFYGKLF